MEPNKLIDVYRNSPTAESLCKFLNHDLLCDFIMIYWYANNGFWVIPIIYDKTYGLSTTWILDEEPTIDNIPVNHIKILTYSIIKSKSAHILISNVGDATNNNGLTNNATSNNISNEYSFVIEAFIEKLATDDLLQRQKNKQELMLSNISHSIRTPLNGILHMTNSIIASKTPQSDHLEYLNQSAIALATNIFDIIDMTKLESNKLTINKDVFKVEEMVSSVMAIANSLNKSNKITLESYIDPSVPAYICSDIKRIKQILINLLENSLQHTKEGEIILYIYATIINLADEDKDNSLYVTTDANTADTDNATDIYTNANTDTYTTTTTANANTNDATAYTNTNTYTATTTANIDTQFLINFTVKDSGVGMDEQTKKNIFKPLELLSNNKQHGLSLRISYMLAKLLGGNLSLIKSDLNVCTCFEFSLVAYEENQPLYITNTIKTLKNKSVLLLDNTNDRIVICQILEKYEMPYIVASTCEEVLVLHADKSFDLIIIKLVLKDPITIIKKIKDTFNSKTLFLSIGDLPKKMFDDSIDTIDKLEFKCKLLELFSKNNNKSYNLSILVVEDEHINRIVIEKLLRQLQYKKIDLAVNGEDALKILTNNLDYYDVILIDIRMPLMNGFELANYINKLAIEKNIKVPKMIGVTAQVVNEDDIKPWFKDFIYKPINTKELRDKLKMISTR